jgi:hypothetical protein
MRRLTAIPALALLLALPLWAQHGGGHGGGGGGHASSGGGGHAGSSGGHSSGFSGGGHAGGFSGGSGVHAYSGPRSGSMAPRAFSRPPSSSRPFSRPPISQNRFRGPGVRNFRNNGFRNNCFGYACRGYGYPWAYGAYYDPYWWWDSGSSYDNSNDNSNDTGNDDGYNQNVAVAAEMNRENQAQQGEQQQRMSQEQADGDQDLYARVPMRPAMHEAEHAPVLPDTVLVFRDEHKQEIRNYAIVGQTLWNFAPQHTQKIPLSDLDLPATTKANEDRGLTFRVPAAGEAQ